VLVLGVSGCGTKGAANSVSGKVTLNDEPVKGLVVFVGADNKEVSAPTNPNGTYTLDNPPLGQVKVLVKTVGPVGVDTPPPKDAPNMPKAGGVAPPAKYASAATSGLTYEVKAGKHTYDIPLKP